MLERVFSENWKGRAEVVLVRDPPACWQFCAQSFIGISNHGWRNIAPHEVTTSYSPYFAFIFPSDSNSPRGRGGGGRKPSYFLEELKNWRNCSTSQQETWVEIRSVLSKSINLSAFTLFKNNEYYSSVSVSVRQSKLGLKDVLTIRQLEASSLGTLCLLPCLGITHHEPSKLWNTSHEHKSLPAV